MTNYLWFLTRSGFSINSLFFSEYSIQNISEILQRKLFYIQNIFPAVKEPYDILSYIVIPFLLRLSYFFFLVPEVFGLPFISYLLKVVL